VSQSFWPPASMRAVSTDCANDGEAASAATVAANHKLHCRHCFFIGYFLQFDFFKT
jgi:hypothetical protein